MYKYQAGGNASIAKKLVPDTKSTRASSSVIAAPRRLMEPGLFFLPVGKKFRFSWENIGFILLP
jgi:hypothetical protein